MSLLREIQDLAISDCDMANLLRNCKILHSNGVEFRDGVAKAAPPPNRVCALSDRAVTSPAAQP
ncbi:MAG TPA: hypothetical protein VHU83_00740 [Bryobacteraceae bacterium]|nr:hypothetical protein [Bryobacteraceae bacterium]